jgi:hypothetical protein
VKKTKSKLPKSPTEKKVPKAPKLKGIGKSQQSPLKANGSFGKTKQSAVSGPGGGSGGSAPASKEEIYSSIKDFEMQLFSFPPFLEATPEVNQQRAMIEAQIGQLKEQLKKAEEQEQEANLSAKSAMSSGSGDSQISLSTPKKEKEPEEEEEELVDKKANEIVELTDKEDTIKDGSSSKQLSKIQKEFNHEHKTIVNNMVQGQEQAMQVSISK